MNFLLFMSTENKEDISLNPETWLFIASGVLSEIYYTTQLTYI